VPVGIGAHQLAGDLGAVHRAGDHAEAKTLAAEVIDQIGFDTVDAGSLAESWHFEPDAAAYTRLYLADPTTPDERILQAPSRPVPAADLRRALQATERVRVGERVF
jgi:hypothetical protein